MASVAMEYKRRPSWLGTLVPVTVAIAPETTTNFSMQGSSQTPDMRVDPSHRLRYGDR